MTCRKHSTYYKKDGVCDVDDGFVIDPTEPPKIVPCDKKCKTCNGTSNKDCTSCKKNFVLKKGECVSEDDNGSIQFSSETDKED